MKVNKNIEIIVISVLFVAVFIQARSVSNVGDIRSEKTDDKWSCDMIECPVNTDRCFVSKSNEEQRSVLKRVNICFSKDNTILAQTNSSSAINTNNSVRQYINFYSNGGTYTSGDKSAINIDQKAFNEIMEREMEKLHSDLNKMQEEMEANMRKEMNKLRQSMRQMDNDLAYNDYY